MEKRSTSQFLWALCLLVIGAVLLLVNLNVISFEVKNLYLLVYPFVLVLYGLYLFLKSFSYKDSGHLFWGLFFTTLSGFLIADRFGIIDFRFWDFWRLWPIIFIFMALNMLFFKKKTIQIEKKIYVADDHNLDNDEKEIESSLKNDVDINKMVNDIINDFIPDQKLREQAREKLKGYQGTIYDKKSKTKANVRIKRDPDGRKYVHYHKAHNHKQKNRNKNTDVNVLGMSISEKVFKDPNWLLEPMNLSSMIVDFYVDFSKAFIPEGETPVKLKGRVGEIVLLIPEDIPIKLTAKNSIGNIEVFGQDLPNVGTSRAYTYESPGYMEATRKLNLEIKLSIGSIEIVQV